MKKAIVIIVLYLAFVLPVTAQSTILYLPLVLKEPKMPDMTLGLVKPRLDYNYILNPSAEALSNFSSVGTGTAARSTTYQKYGLYSYSVTTPANGDGIELTTSALTNAPHFFTVRVRFMTQINLQLRLNSTTKTAQLLEKVDDDWYLYGAFFSASESSGGTAVRVIRFGAGRPGTNGFYIDGAHAGPMLDSSGGYSTYIDGTQEGCLWVGAPHGSMSYRSADSLAGGAVIDFFKGYKFFLKRIMGAGVVTPELSIDSYALLPGGELNSEKTPSRTFTLVGEFYGDSEEDLHAKQQALELALNSQAYPGSQQLRFRFYKSAVQKEIAARYSGGLEGDLAVYYNELEPGDDNWKRVYKYLMPASIQLTATDPFWYEVGESAKTLDTLDSLSVSYIARRAMSTGQWSNLGNTGTGAVYCMVEDDTYVYIGGLFSNWDGIANADNIVRYNKATGVFSAMGTGVNAQVNSMVIGPDGTIYVGGQFTSAGGVANTNKLASWDGTQWVSIGDVTLGVGTVGVFALAIGLDGTLYAAGNFVEIDSVVMGRIGQFDGTTWTDMGTGANDVIETLAIGLDGTLYAAGAFTTMDGGAAAKLAYYSEGVWDQVGDGLSGGDVYTLAVAPNGDLYMGGSFTSPYEYITYWDGATYLNLGSGVNDVVNTIEIGIDGIVYVGGQFTEAGDITLADMVAKWNRYSWSHLDIDFPGASEIYSILASQIVVDPVESKNYDLYVGFSSTGTASIAGVTAVTNPGTVAAFPKIVFNRSGGTSAILQSVRNERTGRQLLFDYSLLDGESLVLDLQPKDRSVTSSYFNKRKRFDAVLVNSDLSIWQVLPGENDVTVFISVSGSPTVTSYMLWRNAYLSWN